MVLSTVLGTKDQDQVATMAKQAGEVSKLAHAYLLCCLEALCIFYSRAQLSPDGR